MLILGIFCCFIPNYDYWWWPTCFASLNNSFLWPLVFYDAWESHSERHWYYRLFVALALHLLHWSQTRSVRNCQVHLPIRDKNTTAYHMMSFLSWLFSASQRKSEILMFSKFITGAFAVVVTSVAEAGIVVAFPVGLSLLTTAAFIIFTCTMTVRDVRVPSLVFLWSLFSSSVALVIGSGEPFLSTKPWNNWAVVFVNFLGRLKNH